MNFTAHTQEQLREFNLENETIYTIQYLNRDYFNGEENIEVSKAKAIVHESEIVFMVTDPYGMDKFIKEVRIIL